MGSTYTIKNQQHVEEWMSPQTKQINQDSAPLATYKS